MEKELNKYKNLTFLFAGIIIGAFIFGALFLSYNKFGSKKDTSYQYSGNELDITDYEKELNKEEKKEEKEEGKPVSTPVSTPVPTSTPVPVKTPVPTSTPTPKVESKPSTSIVDTFKNSTSTDNDVMGYMDSVTEKINNNTVTEAGASTYFTTIVDFLFYGGTIKGHTFSELSESAKLKATAAGSAILDYLDTKFPGLSESLSNEYYTAKNKIKNFYNTQMTKYCSEHPDICEEFNLDYENFKEIFGGTFSTVGESIVSKLDEWYQIYKAS